MLRLPAPGGSHFYRLLLHPSPFTERVPLALRAGIAVLPSLADYTIGPFSFVPRDTFSRFAVSTIAEGGSARKPMEADHLAFDRSNESLEKFGSTFQ